jgi:hypothetical protein
MKKSAKLFLIFCSASFFGLSAHANNEHIACKFVRFDRSPHAAVAFLNCPAFTPEGGFSPTNEIALLFEQIANQVPVEADPAGQKVLDLFIDAQAGSAVDVNQVESVGGFPTGGGATNFVTTVTISGRTEDLNFGANLATYSLARQILNADDPQH